MRPRGAHNLLSHLPLHSQQPSRAPNMLIPIGGIHMIPPRSPLQMYSFLSSTTANTSGASMRLSEAPKGRLALPHRQDVLKEMPLSSQASLPNPEATGQMPAGVVPNKKNQGSFSIQQPLSPRTETTHLEVSADAPVRERCVYPENSQGQKKAPSSQTQL